MKKYRRSLFIFRRDLRLQDNTGLIFALENSDSVIPIFILTFEQIENNPYKSEHCLKFMIESLLDLSRELKKRKGRLYLFRADPAHVVESCIKELSVDAVIVNQDYTPYSKKRDASIEKRCKAHKIAFHSFEDLLLHSPQECLKKNGTPYLIFTPYFRNASKKKIKPALPTPSSRYFQGAISFACDDSLLTSLLKSLPPTTLEGGRREALKILKSIGNFKEYAKKRDLPAESGCTCLSPYLKFNVCSIREVYAAISQTLGPHHPLIRSLYWRDFFTSLLFFYPRLLQESFQPRFKRLKWSKDKAVFKRWCEGKTGFPIVDAGMREMNETGYMHNRVRMITASLLVKDLHIDWRWGEKYFAQTLIDYDPAVNNGNWQWVAGTGCDAQPYFRIFNPWTQQKKFDPHALYIKKWIKELAQLDPKIIHSWYDEKQHSLCPAYPAPLCDHSAQVKKALALYTSSSKRF